MNNKYVKVLICIAAFLVLALVTIGSYAYFVANVSSNSSENVITTGNMAVTFIDDPGIILNREMIPGDSIEKKFSVKNTGDIYAFFDIYLNDVINTFVNTDELLYELKDQDGNVISQGECPSTSGIIASHIGVDVGQNQEFLLKITFLNTDYNQDVNKNAMFSSIISIEEGLKVHSRDKTMYYLTQFRDNNYTDDFDIAAYQEVEDGYGYRRYIKSVGTQYYVETNEVWGFVDLESAHRFSACNNDLIKYYQDIWGIVLSCEENESDIEVEYLQYKYNDDNAIFDNYMDIARFKLMNDISGSFEKQTLDHTINLPIYFKSNANYVCSYNNNEEICFGVPERWDNNSLKSNQVKSFKQELENKGFSCYYDTLNSSIVCSSDSTTFIYKYNSYNNSYKITTGYFAGVSYELRRYNYDHSYSTFDECFEQTVDNHNCSEKDGLYYDYKVLARDNSCVNAMYQYHNNYDDTYPVFLNELTDPCVEVASNIWGYIDLYDDNTYFVFAR